MELRSCKGMGDCQAVDGVVEVKAEGALLSSCVEVVMSFWSWSAWLFWSRNW